MSFNNNLKFEGYFTLTVKDADGRIKQEIHNKNILLDNFSIKLLVVN